MEVTNVWQPWKLNLTTYSCPGSSKSYKSTFWFSGFPKFAYQGAHISLGRNCLNSIPPQDIRQIASLQCHTAGIHGKFCHTFFLISSWTVLPFQFHVLCSLTSSLPTVQQKSLIASFSTSATLFRPTKLISRTLTVEPESDSCVRAGQKVHVSADL